MHVDALWRYHMHAARFGLSSSQRRLALSDIVVSIGTVREALVVVDGRRAEEFRKHALPAMVGTLKLCEMVFCDLQHQRGLRLGRLIAQHCVAPPTVAVSVARRRRRVAGPSVFDINWPVTAVTDQFPWIMRPESMNKEGMSRYDRTACAWSKRRRQRRVRGGCRRHCGRVLSNSESTTSNARSTRRACATSIKFAYSARDERR